MSAFPPLSASLTSAQPPPLPFSNGSISGRNQGGRQKFDCLLNGLASFETRKNNLDRVGSKRDGGNTILAVGICFYLESSWTFECHPGGRNRGFVARRVTKENSSFDCGARYGALLCLRGKGEKVHRKQGIDDICPETRYSATPADAEFLCLPGGMAWIFQIHSRLRLRLHPTACGSGAQGRRGTPRRGWFSSYSVPRRINLNKASTIPIGGLW